MKPVILENEQFLPIAEFEDYLVSNLGRVYSYKTDSILTPQFTGKYYAVQLSKDGVAYNKKLHRLVAEAHNPNPLNKKVVHHLNDVYHYAAHELIWATHSENALFAFAKKRTYYSNPVELKMGQHVNLLFFECDSDVTNIYKHANTSENEEVSSVRGYLLTNWGETDLSKLIRVCIKRVTVHKGGETIELLAIKRINE